MIKVRTIDEQYEAKLYSAESSQRVGKLEWKRYSDGSLRMKLTVRKLALAGRAILLAKVDGDTIAEVLVSEGSGKVDGEDVLRPELRAGQTVQLCHGDTVLASGKLEAD